MAINTINTINRDSPPRRPARYCERYAKNKIMIKLIIIILTLPLLAYADVNPQEHKEEFTWSYSEFIYTFQSKNWDEISKFESNNTKCGLGPGEEGLGCIRRAVHQNGQCHKEMLVVLKQGCKLEQTNEQLSCTSPPQWLDESIIILGARASFSFNPKLRRLTVESFICGGD